MLRFLVQVNKDGLTLLQRRDQGRHIPVVVARDPTRRQTQPFLSVRFHQDNVIEVVLIGQTAESKQQILAVLFTRIGQEMRHACSNKGIPLQDGRVVELIIAPGGNLIGFEMGDGGQIPFDLEPHGLFLLEVKPYPAGKHGEKHQCEQRFRPTRKDIQPRFHALSPFPLAIPPCLYVSQGPVVKPLLALINRLFPFISTYCRFALYVIDYFYRHSFHSSSAKLKIHRCASSFYRQILS